MFNTPFEDRWTSPEQRHELGNRSRIAFEAQVQAASMVEQDARVDSYLFLPGEYLLKQKQLPRFQDVRKHLVSFPSKAPRRFISHRWLSAFHPDPHGRQLRQIQQHIRPDYYYWIDYCCLPQPPMSADDGVILDQCLSGLASLLYHVELMSIRQHGDGYLDRAWCFFEMLAGIVIADGFAQRFEGPNEAPLMESAERKVMESALLSRNLPRNLAVTRPEDLPRIREMTETTTAFFALHTVMHYLTLGQRLSEQRLFWGEDPYYHLAVCDMTEVAKWVFEKSREHNLPLNAMRNNEKTDNFFLKLAEREDFYHDIDPRRLPKKVTMEQSKLAWFMIRKDKAMSPELESANNLFYILSSLIR